MSQEIEVTKIKDGWTAVEPGAAQFVYQRLADTLKRAQKMLADGKSAATGWHYTDDYMQAAAALARRRAALKAEQAAIAQATDELIQDLAVRDLPGGDIAAALGISAERVSQILYNGEWLHDGGDAFREINLVKLKLEEGWKVGRVRGPLPDSIPWAGRMFDRTGMGSSVGEQDVRWTYLLRRPVTAGRAM
ncbi:hypothetical protein [Leifsonia aquatica]|uniref:hypothetical protein n=1 Tax=Leifsonia aquatica TaxID=144185 RepID=UPI0038278D70